MKTVLIAPCGMNCGTCGAYLRDKNKCPGCRVTATNKAVSVMRCKIKNCEVFQVSSAKYCFHCENFPCKNLKHLDKRYRTRYKMSVIENLEKIRESGIRKFAKDETLRWTCSQCAGTICVHKGNCYDCGKK